MDLTEAVILTLVTTCTFEILRCVVYAFKPQ